MLTESLEQRQLLAADYPLVEAVEINGGQVQRSSLTQIAIRFDQLVDVDTTLGQPVTLFNTTTSTIVAANFNQVDDGGKTLLELTFPDGPSVLPSAVIANSLSTGEYQLRVYADSISSATGLVNAGNPLDGNGDTIGGDDFVYGGYTDDDLFRFYGEASGDGPVGLADFAVFRSAFGNDFPDVGYSDGLDSNRDGSIGLTDFASFRRNFGNSRPSSITPVSVVDIMRSQGTASEPDIDGSLTIQISNPRTVDTTINYVVGGDAVAGSDYVDIGTSATILAGHTSVSIPVNVINDPAVEPDETVSITLVSIDSDAGTSVEISPTGTTGTLTILDGGAENQPPDVFANQTLALPGPIALGSYLGRIPAFDPDGDTLTYAINTGGGSLPIGLVSVDPDTGDLYLSDAELLPAGGTSGTLSFTATDPDGLATSGIVTITLPGLPETVSDDYRDAGSHRSGITFDLRPTSVSAAGETLYTTLLKPDGNPLLPGETLDDAVGGYTYGTYAAGLDGVLTYTPNETLYEDQFFSFADDFFLTGVSRLERPEQTLVLLAGAGANYKPLAERKATPRLTNTQPVGIADGIFSFDNGVLETRPVYVGKDDLLSIDVSQWFIDPDGDDVIATTAFQGAGGDEIDVSISDEGQSVLVDVIGEELPFFPFTTSFNESSLTIYIGDHQNATTGAELEIALRNFGDSFPVFEVPEGIKYLDNTDRDDVGSTGIRDAGSSAWQQRWNDWRVSSTTFASGHDRQQTISIGSASIDLTTASAKVFQPLPIADAFDELSVPLGGLVYSGELVDNKTLAKLVVDVPADENRDIDRFDVTVQLADHFRGNAGSPASQTFAINVDPADQDEKRFELTVPIIDQASDVLDSGIFGYQVQIVPHFTTASSDTADRRITLRSSGRVAVVKQTVVEPSDFAAGESSYSDFAPEFSDGWQLAGLPRLILDRGNIQAGNFESDPGSILEISIPQAIIQFPGSDKLSVFRGTPDTPGQPYALQSSSFTPVDLEFGTPDQDEFGTLANSGNVLTYTDASGTEYQFERFNANNVPGRSGDATPQFLVTQITPPDGNGLIIDYHQANGTAATPKANNTGTTNNGPLRIHSIQPLRAASVDPGSLTFRYNADDQVEKIVFGDTREIDLDYTSGQLTKITQSTAAGLDDVLHEFAYTTVGTAADQTDFPLIRTVTHSHKVGANTEVDDFTELVYSDGGIQTATHGQSADTPTVTTLETFWSQKETARVLPDGASDLPAGDLILPGDDAALLAATSVISIRTAAGDLQRYDETTGAGASVAGDHVTRYHLDERGNVIVTDSLFDPDGSGASDELLQSRSKADYDHFDNPVKLTDAIGRETTMLYDYTYPSNSNVLGVTTHTGTTRHLPTLIQSPAGIEQIRRESTILAAMGAPVETVDVLGRRSTFAYDTVGNLLTSADLRDGADDRLVTTTFDNQSDILLGDFNRVATITSPLGLVTTFDTFNSTRQRLPEKVTTTQPAVPVPGGTPIPARTWTTETTYDSRGYVNTITTKENDLTVSWEDFDYDDLGRMTAMTMRESPTGTLLRQSSYRYDSLGRQIKTIDGRGAVNTTDFDTAGRVIETIAADGSTFTAASTGTSHSIAQKTDTVYYADGSVKQQTLPDGTTVKQYHDPAVVLTSEEETRSPSSEVAAARHGSQSWTVTSGVSSGVAFVDQVTTSRADEMGRGLSEEDLLTGQTTTLAYGQALTDLPTRVSQSANVGSLTNAPDSGDVIQVTAVTDYDAASQAVRIQRAGSAADIYTYDELGYVSGREVAATFGLKESIRTDAVGNQIRAEQTVKQPGTNAIQARVTIQIFDGSSALRQIIDAENRVTSIAIVRESLSVDADGDGGVAAIPRVLLNHTTMTPDGSTTSVATDAAGQAVRESGVFGSIITSTYNPAGDRTRKVVADPRSSFTASLPGGVNTTLTTNPDQRTDFVLDKLGRIRQTQYVGAATFAGTGTFSTFDDYFLPVDNGGIDHLHTNDQGGETETTLDSIGKPVSIAHPFLGLDSDGVTLRPQTFETFVYEHDADAQTTLVTRTQNDTSSGIIRADQQRVNRQLLSADGRLLVDADFFGSGKGASDLPGSLSTTINGGSSLDYVAKAINVYSENLDLDQARDAGLFVTSFTYDHPSDLAASAGTGKRINTDDVRGRFADSYNSVGDRVSTRDAANNTTTWTYDRISRPTTETTQVPIGMSSAVPAVGEVSRSWSYSDPGQVVLTNRDGKTATTNVNYSIAAIDVTSSDYQQKTYLNGDGSTLAVADLTLPLAGTTSFGTGQSRVVYQYDAVGRMVRETSVINQNGVDTPSVQATMGYDGMAMDSRAVAIAPSGTSTGFTTIVNSSYDIDNRGRVDSIGQDFQTSSQWKAGTLPQDLAISALYEIDGQIDRLDRYVGGATVAAGTLAIQSAYDYRQDGYLEEVSHVRPGIGGAKLAEHGLSRLNDGRPLNATAEVFTRTGISLSEATGTYAYDTRGNVNNLAVTNPSDNSDLLPGFKPIDSIGEVVGVAPLAAGHRQLGDTDRYFRYDKEGRQVLDFVDGVSSNDITALAYDIAGRLRQVTRTNDPAIGFDTVETTSHAYDAAGRRVATRNDVDGTVTTEGFYGASSMPELVFGPPVSGTSTTGRVKLHQSYVPGVPGTAAISGHDGTGQTVWTLADYGGSTRAYASANPDGSISAILHQNFDGQGLPISVIDNSSGKFSTEMLPVSFAGNHRDPASEYYAVGGANWYAAHTGRRLASNAGGGNDNFTLSTSYGNARVGEVDQQTFGEVFWPRYKELLSDPTQLDNGLRQVFYVNAAVTGVAAVAAGGIVLAGGGAITVGLGGFGTAAAGAGTSATVSSAAVGGAIGTGISIGVAAYNGDSLSSAAVIGAGSGIVGGTAAGAIGLPGRLAASRLASSIAAGGAGGAAEGAFRAIIDGQSVGGIARAAVTDGLLGAVTAGLVDRTIVGIGRANQAVRQAITKTTVSPTTSVAAYKTMADALDHSELADSAISGTISYLQRFRILRAVKKEFGVSLKVVPNQQADRFVGKFGAKAGEIHSTGSRFGRHNRGTFLEEIQHGIDNALGNRPRPYPALGTLENLTFHREVFQRLTENPVLRRFTNPVERDRLMSFVNEAIDNWGAR